MDVNDVNECASRTNSIAATDEDTVIQKEKIERSRVNKERAIELRRTRMAASHPYSRPDQASIRTSKPKVNTAESHRDSHAGYIIEDEPTGHSLGYRTVEETGTVMSCLFTT